MVKFTVMSRERAKNYTFSEQKKVPYIMISINDAHSLPNMLNRDPMMRALCILHFDDVEQGSTAMRAQDAHKILSLINTYINDVEEIVVHCGAGISRSAGVCAAIMKILTDDDAAIFNNAKYKPNMACYRKVLNAYFGMPSFGFVPSPTHNYPTIDAFRAQSMHDEEKAESQTVRACDASMDKGHCSQTGSVAQTFADILADKATQSIMRQRAMHKEKPYVICIKKVADIYGKPLSDYEHVYEYAQIGPLACMPDWGGEDGAMKFATDTEAADWFRENKEFLLKFKQQYDWTTLAIRQVSYSYIALTCEDPEPEELTLEQAKEILFGEQEEANEAADNAAAGYDEGFYVGLSEGYEKALEILNKIKA